MKTHLIFDVVICVCSPPSVCVLAPISLCALTPISLCALPHISVGLSAIDCLREPAMIPLLCSCCCFVTYFIDFSLEDLYFFLLLTLGVICSSLTSFLK